MALIGLDTYKIQLLGRWLCAIVLRYCRLAPISDVARDYRTASHNTKPQEALNDSSSANAKMIKRMRTVVVFIMIAAIIRMTKTIPNISVVSCSKPACILQQCSKNDCTTLQ